MVLKHTLHDQFSTIIMIQIELVDTDVKLSLGIMRRGEIFCIHNPDLGHNIYLQSGALQYLSLHS